MAADDLVTEGAKTSAANQPPVSFFHIDLIDSLNPSSCKTRTHLFYKVSIIVADDLVTQGTRALLTLTMILT